MLIVEVGLNDGIEEWSVVPHSWFQSGEKGIGGGCDTSGGSRGIYRLPHSRAVHHLGSGLVASAQIASLFSLGQKIVDI